MQEPVQGQVFAQGGAGWIPRRLLATGENRSLPVLPARRGCGLHLVQAREEPVSRVARAFLARKPLLAQRARRQISGALRGGGRTVGEF